MHILIDKADFLRTARTISFADYEVKEEAGETSIILHTRQGAFQYELLESIPAEERKQIYHLLESHCLR